MLYKESLRKIKILSIESIDYFGAKEHHWVVEKKIRIWISKTVMARCGKLSLYANES